MYPVYVKILTTRQKVESEGSVALKKIFFNFGVLTCIDPLKKPWFLKLAYVSYCVEVICN